MAKSKMHLGSQAYNAKGSATVKSEYGRYKINNRFSIAVDSDHHCENSGVLEVEFYPNKIELGAASHFRYDIALRKVLNAEWGSTDPRWEDLQRFLNQADENLFKEPRLKSYALMAIRTLRKEVKLLMTPS